jgi:hypothetical protein
VNKKAGLLLVLLGSIETGCSVVPPADTQKHLEECDKSLLEDRLSTIGPAADKTTPAMKLPHMQWLEQQTDVRNGTQFDSGAIEVQ